MKKTFLIGSGILVAAAFAFVYQFGLHHGKTGEALTLTKEAHAAQAESSASPVKALEKRDVYYPGSEDLAPDEMRVIACGTGMPNARPKQAAACWLNLEMVTSSFSTSAQAPQNASRHLKSPMII
jgi:hypothetical protein